MKINFKLEKEDLINFSLFNYKERLKKSKTNKIIILIVTLYLIFNYVIQIIQDGTFTIEDWIGLFTTLLVMFIIFFINYLIFKKLNIYLIRRSINKWDFSSSIWKYNLEILDNNFRIQWDESETKFSMNKIINIVENDKYFYLYFNAFGAYVINKNTVAWDKDEMFKFFRDNLKIKTK